jgi:hypothetical protein
VQSAAFRRGFRGSKKEDSIVLLVPPDGPLAELPVSRRGN